MKKVIAISLDVRKKSWRFGLKAGETTCGKVPFESGAHQVSSPHMSVLIWKGKHLDEESVRRAEMQINYPLCWRSVTFEAERHLSPAHFIISCSHSSALFFSLGYFFFHHKQLLWQQGICVFRPDRNSLICLQPWIRMVQTTGPGESDLLAAFSTIWNPLQSRCRIEH